ncbi:white collar-1 transcript variant 2 [Lepidopterella palustris CBS 459.81]|uniref:White collar-1 transcript variant 2 n=1 Tax=Lepidopterella palustris CBS 459.81 TaxID=1314670 RepID=A0A8E2JJ74_9PEZI|nr:white collar-1 transcript variant 2 [Lepidopterella palustris CBS 459.81]
MNGYPSYQPRQFATDDRGNVLNMAVGHDGMNSYSMVGGQSLDDIVNQNTKAMRRRSMPMQYSSPPVTIEDHDVRRMSMMDFNGMQGGTLDNFQFDPAGSSNINRIMRNSASYPQPSQSRRPSASELALNTQFSNQNLPYTSIPPPGSTYTSPLHPNTSLDMDMTSPFEQNSLPMPLDVNDTGMTTVMGNDMNMFPQAQFASPMINSPETPGFTTSMQGLAQDSAGTNLQTRERFSSGSGNATPDKRSAMSSRTNSQEQQDVSSNSRPHSNPLSVQSSSNPMPTISTFAPGPPPETQPAIEPTTQTMFAWAAPPEGFPSTLPGSRPHMESQYKNAYSSTGFDMLGVLMRVATRPNPEINIGSVDLSCAFVVCDAQMDDDPIVYCSENFERLTGYNKHMILGRNCRFLQSPDGMVQAGVKRKYVDDDSVFYLKNMINMRREAQISLINYRRGGQPFMNLLTMIPITWDNTEDIKFFVGFQVDLVEQPNSMTNKNPDGSYSVNYQRGLAMPRYIFNPAEHASQPDLGQIPRDEVSNVLATFGTTGNSEIAKRLWDKVLLENTDDVVHVLSLKGLFLYLSPSSRTVLEYEASELVGTALSSVCHPSDIVPVTRELKDTTSGVSVNVVFRIRRKHSGYMWFEGHGSLHTEQGKGRKCIILVGRERPVYTLSKSDIRASGGIGDNELWTKMSTSGMFLFVSSNVRQLLDRQPEELVGTSIQALMRQESKAEFGRIMELTRTGRKGEVKHEMINKRGQVLQAFSTIYPGDATEGHKPTFVVAQTRLLKYSRGGGQSSQRPTLYPKQERTTGESQESVPSNASNGVSSVTGGAATNATCDSTPRTDASSNQFQTTDKSAPTYTGQNGLAIGHQDASLASDENVFDELKTTRSTSWQYELRQMEKQNRLLAEEVQSLLAAKKKRKRRKGAGQLQKDCANCHTRVTPEWRRGPSGNRDLCNSCGLRWAKQNGRVSPRTPSQHSQQSDKSKTSASPRHNHTILPNVNDTGAQPSIPATLAAADKRTSQQANTDSHAAKVARMEVGASQGLAGGVPPRIDEGIEPD